jgi:hypothetical protein
MHDWPEIKSLYAEAADFFAGVERRLHDASLPFYGFKLLNAPPIRRPEYLFVGYQPGGGVKDHLHELKLESHLRWPDTPEYVAADWDLADRMRETFPHDALTRSVGSNVIFLRWPNVEDYRTTVPRGLREDVEKRSRGWLARMVDVINPQRVVTIGFGALGLEPTPPALFSPNKRVLIRRGCLCGRKAVGMLHLTGCRISRVDRAAIKDWFAQHADDRSEWVSAKVRHAII